MPNLARGVGGEVADGGHIKAKSDVAEAVDDEVVDTGRALKVFGGGKGIGIIINHQVQVMRGGKKKGMSGEVIKQTPECGKSLVFIRPKRTVLWVGVYTLGAKCGKKALKGNTVSIFFLGQLNQTFKFV